MGKRDSFLGKIVHLDLCLLGAVSVHTADTGVARVNCLSTGNLANSLSNFTEPLDAFGNAAYRLFRCERVDLGLSARYIEVGQDQDIVQCNDCGHRLAHWRM